MIDRKTNKTAWFEKKKKTAFSKKLSKIDLFVVIRKNTQ